jgi:hypothetical protein
LDGLVVAFDRAAGRSLPTPAWGFSQEVPHPCRVVGHAGHPFDHLRHTLQGPQLVRVTIGFTTFEQLRFELDQLLAAYLRRSPGSTSPAQAIS